jgi:hypothetical protein
MESLLSILVSLRDFKLYDVYSPSEEFLSIVISSPHLQYFSVLSLEGESCCWKQIRGEWIVCDETESPFGPV